MGKPDGHPRKDVTIVPSCGKFGGPSSKPPNGNHEFLSNLSYAVVKLEVHYNQDSAKQHKFNKIETDPTKGFKNNCHINFEPSSGKKSSKQGDSSSPSQQESNHGFTPDHGSVLTLVSCLNCYLHVMVSGASPKCPKCGMGDCLLDMFHMSPVKIERTV